MKALRFSIKMKLIISSLFIAGSIIVIVTFFSLKRERQHVRDELVKRGRDVTGVFTQMTAPLLFSMDYIAIFDNGKELIKKSDILSMVLTDEKGRVLVSTEPDTPTFITMDLFNQQIIQGRTLQYREVYLGGKKHLEFVCPVIILGDVDGLVHIWLSDEGMNEQLLKTTYAIAYQALGIMGLAVIMAILLSRIFDPIKILVRGTDEVAKGNLDYTISEKYGDEIGDLARSFNAMRRNLKKSFSRLNNQADEIRKLNEDLENRVKERTGRLQQEITERKQIEKKLQDTNDNLEQMVEDRTAKLRDINTDLMKAKQDAENANRLKSEFIANVSHEIRTPLNSILGFSQIMAGKISDLGQKKNLSYIINSGKALLSMVNDILELSKIEAGLMQPNYESFYIKDLLHELMQLFAPEITEKKLEIIVEISGDLPECVTLDKVRVRQILMNLLGNSVKFTRKGYIKLGAYRSQTEPNSLIFFVEDSGPGIPGDKIAFIFDAFNQLHKTTAEFPGLGLGLTVARRLIKMLQGELSVQSELGKGSTFKVALKNVGGILGANLVMKEPSFGVFARTPEKADFFSFDENLKKESELLELLKKEKTRCRELTKVMSIDMIEDFAKEMKDLGTRHHFEPLVTWAEILYRATHEFDVEKIDMALQGFMVFGNESTK